MRLLCVACLSGAGAIYLMVRIELDRIIFEDAAGVAERVRGLLRLVRALAFVFIAELLLALASLWIARWLF